MEWTGLEEYRQLQQDYERQLTDYRRVETAYSDAQASDDVGRAHELYYQLVQQRPQLEQLYDRLRKIRSDLAQTRDEARTVAL